MVALATKNILKTLDNICNKALEKYNDAKKFLSLKIRVAK
jgi:hypothetical protein